MHGQQNIKKKDFSVVHSCSVLRSSEIRRFGNGELDSDVSWQHQCPDFQGLIFPGF